MNVEGIKPVRFRGSSLEDLRDFPAMVRREAGYQLGKVQEGQEPNDWKPMTTSKADLDLTEKRYRDLVKEFKP